MTNDYIFWGGGLLMGIIQYLLKDKHDRLMKDFDSLKTDVDHSKTRCTEEISSLKSRVKVVETQLHSDVSNLSKQIEALQGSIRHLENTINANAKAMYDLFMDLKNERK